jgi:lipoyl(octanoyl) transferase
MARGGARALTRGFGLDGGAMTGPQKPLPGGRGAASGPIPGPVAKTVAWHRSGGLVAYPAALAAMDLRARQVREGTASELLWFLEHPPLYTAGTSAADDELLTPERFPVFRTGRGGRFTYHGPGQRVAYAVLDLRRPGPPDVRRYVQTLEAWLIAALAHLGVAGGRREGRIGIWVNTPTGEAKIAALGVRISRWITTHGIALNVDPDLSHFAGIVPCGITEHGVTSLKALGVEADMAEVDDVLRASFEEAFDARLVAADDPPKDAERLQTVGI